MNKGLFINSFKTVISTTATTAIPLVIGVESKKIIDRAFLNLENAMKPKRKGLFHNPFKNK